MLLLTATTDKIQLRTGAAASVNVHSSSVDNAAGTITFDRKNTNITTATDTDIVSAPASSTTRNVKMITVRNKDAALPCWVTVLFNQNGTISELHSELLLPGEHLHFIEGVGFIKPSSNINALLAKILTADDTGGTAGNSAQPWFPTTGTLTVPGATTFLVRGLLKITSGATSHSTGLSLGGTATLTSFEYYAQAHRSAADTIISTFSGIHISGAANATVDAAGTQVGHYIQINGILRINVAGTIIPQFTFSANPTGTITIKRNSFFLLQALGDNKFASAGSWA